MLNEIQALFFVLLYVVNVILTNVCYQFLSQENVVKSGLNVCKWPDKSTTSYDM